ncbi:MAG: hypothetical protein AAF502_25805 [Bacteroidota bacterium]
MKKILLPLIMLTIASCGEEREESIGGIAGSQLEFSLLISDKKGNNLLKSDAENGYKPEEIALYKDTSLEENILYQWWRYTGYISKDAWDATQDPNSDVALPDSDSIYVDAKGEVGFPENMIEHGPYASAIPMYPRRSYFSVMEDGTEKALLYLKLKEDVDTLEIRVNYKENSLGRLTHVFHNDIEVFNYDFNPKSDIYLIK